MSYEIFKELCEKRGVKIAEVARATGIAHPTFTAWKKGEYIPKNEKMQKIADFFDVPVSYFYSDEELPSYYFDEATAKLAEEMALKPGIRRLFDASRDLSDESLKMFAEMINTYKKTNPDG